MSSRNDSEPTTPHWRRRLRKIEIRREANRMRSLEASEQEAAAERDREWQHLRNEMDEIDRTDRARPPITTQSPDRNGGHEQYQGFPDLLRQRPRLDVSDSDAPSTEGPVSTARVAVNPPVDAENVGGSDADDELEEPDELDDVNSSDESGEEDASDNPGAPFWGVRYVSKKYLSEQGFLGVGQYSRVYRRKTTDALYFLSNLGEKIWLIDENGDGILAQDQDIDQTIKSSSDEADP